MVGTPWGLLQDHFPNENMYTRVPELQQDEKDVVYKGKRTGRTVRFRETRTDKGYETVDFVEVLDEGDPYALDERDDEAIENGDTEARWVNGFAPTTKKRPMTFIKWNGVNWGGELPERLKRAGVTVVNEKSDVVGDE